MQRALHTGRLYWPETVTPPAPRACLRGSAACDVLVVGAGITGALLAYRLAGRGLDVIVVDRGVIGQGSTAASTALVQYDLDLTLNELSGRVSADRARRAYVAVRDAVMGLCTLCRSLGDVEMMERPSVYLCGGEESPGVLEAECGARRRIGLRADFLDAKAVEQRFGLAGGGALVSGPAMEVNPLKLTFALLARAEGLGVRVHEGTEVDFCFDRGRAVATCISTGARVRCGRVVIATGYEAPHMFRSLKRLTRLRSTYAFATAPLETSAAWGERALIWEHDDPYCYARTTRDGRVLVGGEDNGLVTAHLRDRLLARSVRRLVKRFGRIAPGVELRPQYAWAGTFAETVDSLACIGEHPGWPGVDFCLGYGGNGIAFAAAGAMILADRAQGREHEWSDLFSLDRGGAGRGRSRGSSTE